MEGGQNVHQAAACTAGSQATGWGLRAASPSRAASPLRSLNTSRHSRREAATIVPQYTAPNNNTARLRQLLARPLPTESTTGASFETVTARLRREAAAFRAATTRQSAGTAIGHLSDELVESELSPPVLDISACFRATSGVAAALAKLMEQDFADGGRSRRSPTHQSRSTAVSAYTVSHSAAGLDCGDGVTQPTQAAVHYYGTARMSTDHYGGVGTPFPALTVGRCVLTRRGTTRRGDEPEAADDRPRAAAVGVGRPTGGPPHSHGMLNSPAVLTAVASLLVEVRNAQAQAEIVAQDYESQRLQYEQTLVARARAEDRARIRALEAEIASLRNERRRFAEVIRPAPQLPSAVIAEAVREALERNDRDRRSAHVGASTQAPDLVDFESSLMMLDDETPTRRRQQQNQNLGSSFLTATPPSAGASSPLTAAVDTPLVIGTELKAALAAIAQNPTQIEALLRRHPPHHHHAEAHGPLAQQQFKRPQHPHLHAS